MSPQLSRSPHKLSRNNIGCAMRMRTVEQLGDVTGNPALPRVKYMYIYIYIYICVCVCVRERERISSDISLVLRIIPSLRNLYLLRPCLQADWSILN